MRRLTKPKLDRPERERGAAGVLVAGIMLVLIGAGALAVDAGQIYAERAQLQNGADAGAVAILQACREAGCSQTEAEGIAQELADGNSNDGDSHLYEVVLSPNSTSPTEVTVRTKTGDGSGGAGFLGKMFSAALNAPPAAVGAHATAAIEPISAGSAFPLALSDCRFDLSEAAEAGEVQLIRYSGDPANPPKKPGVANCTSSSGATIPGGFGWLEQDGPCEAATDADENAESDTGRDYTSFKDVCDPILLAWIEEIESGGQALATFPVFDDAGGSGTGGWFHIRGYATFDIQGWKFTGGNKTPAVFRNTPDDTADHCTGECLGIIGQFIRFESIDTFSGGTVPGDDLGTVVVRLIN